MLVLIGIFQAIAGLVAIFNDDFYVLTQNYTFDLDVSAWGWIHLIIGIAVILAGYSPVAGATWAGVTRSCSPCSAPSRTSSSSRTTRSGRSS